MAPVAALLLYASIARWSNAKLAAVDFETVPPTTRWLLQYAHPLPNPTHLGVLLIGIFLLAVGATIYSLRCPPLVQEHTRSKWVHELNRPLLEYQAASFSQVVMRYACLATYATGGLIVCGYLLWRIWFAAAFMFS